ncbi:hypothetical protein [Paenibacillus donghaensis]|nr:hypothetical protein [Paenibacillus donghaensis]
MNEFVARLNDEMNAVNAEIQARELADKKEKLQAAVVHAPININC